MTHEHTQAEGVQIPVVWEVCDKKWENEDTATLTIKPQSEIDVMHPKPGQFNMLYVFGIGEVPISLSGIEEQGLIHTIRAVGKVSKAITSLEVGQQICLRGPFGRPWPLPQGHKGDIVVIAGGVGLAPLRPLIVYLTKQRDAFEHIHLVYGSREPSARLFQKDLPTWQKLIHVIETVDTAPEDWHGDIGQVTSFIDQIKFDPERTLCYLCGPEIMMRVVAATLRRARVPAHKIFLSMERNMKCALGFCGHCQLAGSFVCKDGPVFAYNQIKELITLREV